MTQSQRLLTEAHQLLEPVGVDLPRSEHQRVPGCAGDQGLVQGRLGQSTAQVGDVAAQRNLGALGGASPHRLSASRPAETGRLRCSTSRASSWRGFRPPSASRPVAGRSTSIGPRIANRGPDVIATSHRHPNDDLRPRHTTASTPTSCSRSPGSRRRPGLLHATSTGAPRMQPTVVLTQTATARKKEAQMTLTTDVPALEALKRKQQGIWSSGTTTRSQPSPSPWPRPWSRRPRSHPAPRSSTSPPVPGTWHWPPLGSSDRSARWTTCRPCSRWPAAAQPPKGCRSRWPRVTPRTSSTPTARSTRCCPRSASCSPPTTRGPRPS